MNRFDFGSDPLKYYALRVKLAEEIRANMEKKLEKPGEGYQVLHRSFNSALGQEGYSLYLASKYIGVYHYRSHVGDPGNRLPFEPVPAAKQKEALELLREHLFSPPAFRFSPQLLNKLASPRHSNFVDFLAMRTRFDVPIHDMVLSLQNQVMDRLFHPLVLSRILDSEVKVAPPAEPFGLGGLFAELQDSIWAETKAPGRLSEPWQLPPIVAASASAQDGGHGAARFLRAGGCADPVAPRIGQPARPVAERTEQAGHQDVCRDAGAPERIRGADR